MKDFVTSLSDDAEQKGSLFGEEQYEGTGELEECEEEAEATFEVDEAIPPADLSDLSPATRAPTKKFVNSPKTPCMEKSLPMASESTEITPIKINTSTCKSAWMKLIRLMDSNRSCSMEVKKLFEGGAKET